jgi:membrane protease YdiL (CAAX protease family)
MATSEIKPEAGPALWRRIADFPLVAMVTAVLLYALSTALGITITSFLPKMDPMASLVAKAAINIGVVLATYKLAIRHLGEHPHDDLAGRHALRNLGIGLAAGFLIFSAVVGSAAIADVYNIYGPGSTSQFVHDLVIVAIMPAFMEELLFRGILFRWLEAFGGSWAALVVTSALFGIAHILNPGATWFSSFAIAVEAGILLGGAYMLTRSLWMPMGLHAAWNFTQGFLFDVPVSGTDENGLVQAKLSGPELLSGGSFGLEASLFAVVIATAAGVWLVVLAVRRGELMQPWWVRQRALKAC